MTDVSVLSADSAIRFLEWLDPVGLHNLVAIDPVSKAIEAQTFDFCSDKTLALDWILQRNSKKNLYFSINEPRPGARPDNKLRRDEIGNLRAFAVDLDEVPQGYAWGDPMDDLLPSAVIDSGNGLWGFWKLEEKQSADNWAAEDQNRALAAKFGGDKVATNLDRIARLPGTLNIPNEAKRKKGKTAKPSRILSLGKLTYSPADIYDWCPAVQLATSELHIKEDQTPQVELDLPQSVAKAARWLMLDAPEAVEGDSGNAATYGVAARLKDFGVSQQVAFDLLLDGWNETKAIPPWSAAELRGVVKNAFSYGTAAPGRNAPALAETEFDAVELEETPKMQNDLFEVRSVSDFKWDTERDYLIKGLISRGMVGVLGAPPNAGKSPLVLDIAASVALGEPWQQMRVKQGYVLYYATEGGAGMAARMEALRRQRLVGKADVPFDFRTGALDLHKSTRDTKKLIATVNGRAAHFGCRPGLLVVDTLSHTISGSDSDDAIIRELVRNCKTVVRETGVAIILLHHPAKNRDVTLRGSDLLSNDFDLVMKIDHDKKTDIRELSTPRAKDFREIAPLRFRCGSLELGRDQDGDPITAPYVEWLDAISEFDIQSPDVLRLIDFMEEQKTQNMQNGMPESEAGIVSKLAETFASKSQCSRAAAFRIVSESLSAGVITKCKHGQYKLQ